MLSCPTDTRTILSAVSWDSGAPGLPGVCAIAKCHCLGMCGCIWTGLKVHKCEICYLFLHKLGLLYFFGLGWLHKNCFFNSGNPGWRKVLLFLLFSTLFFLNVKTFFSLLSLPPFFYSHNKKGERKKWENYAAEIHIPPVSFFLFFLGGGGGGAQHFALCDFPKKREKPESFFVSPQGASSILRRLDIFFTNNFPNHFFLTWNFSGGSQRTKKEVLLKATISGEKSCTQSAYVQIKKKWPKDSFMNSWKLQAMYVNVK